MANDSLRNTISYQRTSTFIYKYLNVFNCHQVPPLGRDSSCARAARRTHDGYATRFDLAHLPAAVTVIKFSEINSTQIENIY